MRITVISPGNLHYMSRATGLVFFVEEGAMEYVCPIAALRRGQSCDSVALLGNVFALRVLCPIAALRPCTHRHKAHLLSNTPDTIAGFATEVLFSMATQAPCQILFGLLLYITAN